MITYNPKQDLKEQEKDFIRDTFKAYYEKVGFVILPTNPIEDSLFEGKYTPVYIPEYNRNFGNFEGKQCTIKATDGFYCFADFPEVDVKEGMGNVFKLHELAKT